ncbi:MAG: biopolymer transporter ExbD [Nitrospinae bacterium]|nr:biopolymer transporter ExbD [Nitrospinota bacterium]
MKRIGKNIKKEEVTIEVTQKGDIFFNSEEIEVEVVRQKLEKKLKEKKDLAIIIRADKKVEYGKVIRILGYCKELKIEDVAVAVK